MIYRPGLSIMAQLVAHASAVTGMPRRALLGAVKDQPTCHIRYAIMLIAREYGLSSPKIGKGLGGRDHSTILTGLGRGRELLETEPAFSRLVDAIRLQELEAA